MLPEAPKTLGDYLMHARLEKKLTLKQVAAIIGVSFESVNFWERNLHYPTEWRRERVVAFIGFDPELPDPTTQHPT
jgi:DNA-binding transcriptional regulator YiaG